MNVSIEIVEIFEILLYPLDSGGKSKGSHEFIEIHEGEEDEVSPLPKSANWSEWKQVSFTQNNHFTKEDAFKEEIHDSQNLCNILQ